MSNATTGALDVRPTGSVDSTFMELSRLHEGREALQEDKPPEVFDSKLANRLVWGIVAELLTDSADFADYFEDHALRESVTKGDISLLEAAREQVQKDAAAKAGIFQQGVLEGLDTLVKDDEDD